MYVVKSPSVTTKEIMDTLLALAKDKTISMVERNAYYADYLKLSCEYLKHKQAVGK